MHRVLAYIDEHLDEQLDLATLAEVAHFSSFHFHRLFSAWMGETFGDYLRRRRVEVAAMRLAAQPRTRILNIALSVGFGSAEAFTRAFKSRFGCSPTAWREQQSSQRHAKSNSGQANSKHSQALQASFAEHEVSRKLNKEIIMKVTLIDRQPAVVAYFRHLGPYGEAIARFWQETYVPWAVMNKLGADHARYGISHDDPSITAPEQCRYDACAEVSPISWSRAVRSRQPFQAASMRCSVSKAQPNRLARHGRRYFGTGCLPAGCNLMVAHVSSTTRKVRLVMARRGSLNARYAFP
jgi:AraC family transcriptional regulator